MNIFYLDKDPVQAAKWLHDIHSKSQINESAQLLSGWLEQYTGHEREHLPEVGWVGVQNPNSPFIKWLLEGQFNVRWTVLQMQEMIRQYDRRYHRTATPEKYANARRAVQDLLPWFNRFAMINHTVPHKGFPEKYDAGDSTFDVIRGYRRYYIEEKMPGATWREPGEKPVWENLYDKPKKKLIAPGKIKASSSQATGESLPPTPKKSFIGNFTFKKKD